METDTLKKRPLLIGQLVHATYDGCIFRVWTLPWLCLITCKLSNTYYLPSYFGLIQLKFDYRVTAFISLHNDEHGLLCEGERLFGEKSVWYLQQDNDPTHNIAHAVVKEFNERNGSIVQVLLNWPPNSPDLNLIENFWSWVQNKVYKRGCPTTTAFKEAIKEIISSPCTLKCIDSLYKSMPKRMAIVLKMDGKKSGY